MAQPSAGTSRGGAMHAVAAVYSELPTGGFSLPCRHRLQLPTRTLPHLPLHHGHSRHGCTAAQQAPQMS